MSRPMQSGRQFSRCVGDPFSANSPIWDEEVFMTSGIRNRLIMVSTVLALAMTTFPASATFAGKNGRITFVADLSGTYQLYVSVT